MVFDHEKLDVYRLALEFVAWAYRVACGLSGLHRNARDHLLQASQSISQNIAEGNGKRSMADRRRYFEIARGSSLECAAVLDNLAACQAIADATRQEGRQYLHRLVSMLTRMTEPADRVGEEPAELDYDYEHEHDGKSGVPIAGSAT